MESTLKRICRNKLFNNIDTEKLIDVIPRKPSVFLKEGEVIYSKGQPAKSIYLVLSGSINRIDYNFVDRSRNREVNEVITENQFFGYEEISSRTYRTSTTITLTHAEVFEITIDELDLIIRKNIRVLENLSKSFLEIKESNTHTKFDPPSPSSKGNKIPAFSFKGKIVDKKTSDVKTPRKTDPNEVAKLAESLKREKEFAEKAIAEEMEAITKKEIELAKLEESLAKEKEFAEQELSKEFHDLEEKELKIAELEKSITEQKRKTEKLISDKLKEIKQKEIELNRKASQEKKLLDEALNKTRIIAEKEQELLKRAKALEKEKEHIEKVKAKEEELRRKEEKIERMLKEIDEEKKNVELSKKKENQLRKREEDIDNRFKKIVAEEEANEKYKSKEKELRKKEEELRRLSAALENEKMFAEKTLRSEIEEIKRKEEELKLKEENLKREKELSELALLKEMEELEERERQLQKPAKDDTRDSEIEMYKRQIEELKAKEESLLHKIEKLESKKDDTHKTEPDIGDSTKIDTRVETVKKDEEEPEYDFASGAFEKDIIPESREQDFRMEDGSEPESSEAVKGDEEPRADEDSQYVSIGASFTDNFVVKRDFQQQFQLIDNGEIKIILVNVKRGTANFSADFRKILDTLIESGTRKVIIDISYSDYLDSTFLGVMVRFLKKLSIEGGYLKVILDVTKMTSSTFFLSGMDRVFTIHDNIGSAIREFLS